MGGVDDVCGNHQVVEDELGLVGVVGHDAADLPGGQEHAGRPSSLEIVASGPLIPQIQLVVIAGKNGLIALALQFPRDRRPGKAPMPGHIDPIVLVHLAVAGVFHRFLTRGLPQWKSRPLRGRDRAPPP